MGRRRFSQLERDALFEAADGRCQICGIELEDDWEADHVEPYSKGGKTHIINGQALCQKCNRQKGNNVVNQIELRPFQQEFLDKAIAKSKMQTDEGFLSLVVHAALVAVKHSDHRLLQMRLFVVALWNRFLFLCHV